MPKIEVKQQKVQELEERIKSAKMIIFTDYRGLSVSEITGLRSRLKAAGAEYRVVKNTLARRAFTNAGLEELLPFTEGPNALLFSDEELVEPAKILFDVVKTSKKLEVRSGMVEGKVFNADQIKNLSTLPPREVLVAQVLGGLQAPIYGFAYVLKANLTGLVRALDAVREQKAS
ncbi:MAG: 50S ribosomal protein L10 [Acidobacteriota bacterium]